MVPGREFASDSYVHQPLSPNAEIDPLSDVWVRDLQRQIKQYYGVAAVNITKYAPPLFIVGADHPTVKVLAARGWEPKWSFEPLQQQWNAVPLPVDFQPSGGSDKEAIVYQPSTGRYWEFWVAERTGKQVRNSAGAMVEEWRAAWGGMISNLRENPGYFVPTAGGYKFGTTATSLPLLAGLMTVAEQQRGSIEHPLHFAIPEVRKGVWAFPAQRTDGQIASDTAIPEGVTFRLPPTLDVDKLDMDPYARILARAVQKYGMILRDKAGAVVFYAENPGTRYEVDPYFGRHGILRCALGKFVWGCAPDSNNRLRGFPWDRLQALKVDLKR
jgi:hypothetical protein